LPP
jgi:dienelactone hydrolase